MLASYGNSDVVAPISAPMLQIVPLPVAEIESAPGPWYSMIAPVPPSTVRMRATSRMTSFGARPARQRAGEPDADDLRPADVEREPGHHVDGVGAADADGDHAEAAGVGRVRVGADHHPAGEGVVLEHDLVDDPAARAPEADAVLRRHGAQEVVDLLVGVDGDAEVDRRPDLGLDQVVAVDGRRHGDLRQAGGHELQQGHLGRGVLHGDAVGVEVGVALAAHQLLARRVDEVVDEDLLGQRERSPEALAAERGALGERGVDALDELDGGGGADGAHGVPSGWLAFSAQVYNSNTSDADDKPGCAEWQGIDHVQLAMPAGEEDVARHFYAGVLGIPEVPKPPRPSPPAAAAGSRTAPVRVHLGVEDDFRPARKAHPALLVAGLDARPVARASGSTSSWADRHPRRLVRCHVDRSRSATASSCIDGVHQ